MRRFRKRLESRFAVLCILNDSATGGNELSSLFAGMEGKITIRSKFDKNISLDPLLIQRIRGEELDNGSTLAASVAATGGRPAPVFGVAPDGSREWNRVALVH
jgi:hypothetical protein